MEDAKKNLSFKHIITLILVFLFVIFLVYLKTREYILPKATVQFANETLQIEIAETPASRTRGLGFHKPLQENEGMLFLFPVADRYPFWMKDMKFPIDIIWFNQGRVVDIAPNVPISVTKDLPLYTSRLPYQSALELKAGFSERHGVKIGDPITLLTK